MTKIVLKRRIGEYEALKAEIEALQREVAPRDGNMAPTELK